MLNQHTNTANIDMNSSRAEVKHGSELFEVYNNISKPQNTEERPKSIKY